MKCVYTPQSLEGMFDMVEGCAIAYGGPGWVSLVMIGLAVVLMAVLLFVTVFWLLRIATR